MKSRKLIRRAINGDEQAWGLLVDEYGKVVFSLLRGLGIENRDAGEMTVSLFGELFDSLEELLNSEEDPTLWLARKANRKALDWVLSFRDSNRDPGIAGVYEKVEKQRRFFDALSRLDSECQRVLVLLLSGSLRSRDSRYRSKCLQKLLKASRTGSDLEVRVMGAEANSLA